MGSRFRDRTSSTWFHVYNVGADGQDIFSRPGDQDLFEELMGESSIEHGVDVHAYALMTNHFHALVHVRDESMSEWMRYFCGRYGAAYNGRTSRRGPLFNGRFGSVPIVDDESHSDAQLIVVGRHIHRNPLAFVRPELLPSYRYSSLGVYLGRRPATPWLRTDVLSASPSASRLTHDLDVSDFTDRLPPCGFEPLVATSADEVLAVVDDVAGDIDAALRRVLTMTLAIELRASGIGGLAEQLGVTADSIRRTAQRGRVRLDTEPTLQRLRLSILDRLASL